MILNPNESYAIVSAEQQTYNFVKNHILKLNREVGIYDMPTLFGGYIEVSDNPESDLFISREPKSNCTVLDMSDNKVLFKVLGEILGKTDNKPKRLNKKNQVLHYLCVVGGGYNNEYYTTNEYKSKEQAIFDFAEKLDVKTFHEMVDEFDGKLGSITGFLSNLMQFPEKQNFVMSRLKPDELKTLQDRLLKLAVLFLKYKTLQELELYICMCAES